MSEENDLQEEAVEAVAEEVSVEEVIEEEKPKSGYIDYNLIQDEGLRETVKMRNNADFRKLKEAERKEAEYEKKFKEYEEKLAEQNKPKEVAAPTPDDWYSDPDKAEARQQEYNGYIQSQAEWDAKQKLSQQQAEAEKARQSQERLTNFMQRSESAGINQDELGYAANVAQNVLGEDTQTHLLQHEYGPQILVQLAKSPMELQEIANLNPYQVGVKLEQIAKTFKPTKVTKAPPPDEPIQGTGVTPENDYGGLLKGSQIR
tara:strand:- start:1523 stop:2302 length:780 start_codon:yes stop_codon:yes gene_type:complete